MSDELKNFTIPDALNFDNILSDKTDNNTKGSSITQIITICIIVFIVLLAYKAEKLDLFCPKDVKKHCNLCGDGKGKYYVDGKANKDDTVPQLLNKIKISAEFDINTVKWRRCMLIAFIIVVFITCILIPLYTKLSKTTLFALMMFIVFIVLYLSFSYYQYHYNRYPVHNIKEALHILKDKLKVKHDAPEIIL
jgi:hypothetical protein